MCAVPEISELLASLVFERGDFVERVAVPVCASFLYFQDASLNANRARETNL